MNRQGWHLSARACLIAVLALLSLAPSAQAQTTALFFDSEPGDWIGLGVERTYTPADGTFQISRNMKNGVSVSVNGASFWWNLDFSAAGNAPLTVGVYESARGYHSAAGNGLNVSGSGRGCDITGRFVVRELVLALDGTVLSFAADFEQHCSDANPALFGAIRYSSGISSLQPFDGNYPFYQLTVTPPANGRITGAGVDCGGTATTCVFTPAVATELVLTAVPDTGYAFAGWTGDCTGAVSMWLRVNQRKRCSVLFQPGFQGTTALFLDSQPGDPAGNGIQRTYTPVDGVFQATRNSRNGVTVSVRPPDLSFWWSLDFSAADNAPLAVGSYGAARQYPWTRTNGLSITGRGGACGSQTGRFVVREVIYRADGSVQRFAADFEQHCGDIAPGLFGAIRYESAVAALTPFDGQYPRYELDITPPINGRVSGGGVDCGGGSTTCHLSLAVATPVTLTAVPDPGHVFMGWAGDCRGPATTSVHVNSVKSCAALFEPLVSASPRTLLYWDSLPGDVVGSGRKHVLSHVNSFWSATSTDSGNHVSIRIDDETTQYRFDFSAPQGQPLVAGYYSAARRYPFTMFNGLSVTSGTGCNQLTGRFEVFEIALAADGTVQRFAADFEQHCEDAVPALVGAIRYNATVPDVAPFGGAYPSYQLLVTPAANGRITATGLDCGGAGSQCLLPLTAAAQVNLTATPDAGHVFMGWTNDCSGGPATTLHVNGPKRCSARFEPAVAAPRTLLRWESQPGHYIGGGRGEALSLANSRWTSYAADYRNGVRVHIDSVGPRRGSYREIEFSPPTGEVLQVGRRYVATGNYPAAGVPGFGISSDGSGCSGGEFTIRELLLGPQNIVIRFAADFVQSCGAGANSLLTGSIQYNSLLDIPVTTLAVEPASLRFAALHNGASVTLQPAPQIVRLSVSRPNVGWTATASQSWIQVTPASGTGSALLAIGLNLLGTPPGTGSATGSVTVTLTDGSGASRTINLAVALYLNGTTAPPFGVVDTPAQNTTGVTGALPMTGWALDDLEIASLTICRAAAAGEVPIADGNCGGAAQIFLGNGVFVEGARPDVQTAFPTHPRADRGGWGFMLLTNMLPNQGNGTFVLYAYARDREGHAVLLGTRTITCNNAEATAPFGAIDTPGQGETIGGAAYVNFGWVLTPQPKSIPFDGSTMMVYVDGVPVGSPSYNHYRVDVATLFPGLANTPGPVGFRVLDTTTLSNGLHTIAWTATDSGGVSTGIGSRYFRVSNGAAAVTSASRESSIAEASSAAVARVPLDRTAVAARRGWDPDAPWRHHAPGASERIVVRGEEVDRFELALGQRDGETYAGYLRVGEALRPLPVGSRLDPSTGGFTWSPGVGFIGTYDLVFVRSAGAAAVARREVRIILQAKGSGHVGAQVVIDTPRSQQDLGQPFTLAGWAADLDAAAGTGIDTIHVWAYPLSGGAPVFLGTAALGGQRPDVAAIHGERVRESGFGLTVNGLTPGNYDLAVFAWSTVSGGFVPAQVVRVTAR